MNRSRKMTVGLVLLAVLAALDIVGVAGAGMDGAPPLGVILVSALLGVITLVGVRMAWTGAPRGMTIAIVSRILSAVLGLPVFFVDGTPAWAKVAVVASLVATLVALALVSTTRRKVLQTA